MTNRASTRDLPRSRPKRAGLLVLGVASLLWLPSAVGAQPTAEQVLTDAGLSAGDRQRVLKGEYVDFRIEAVSDRDLAVATAFLVRTPPEALSRYILDGTLDSADEQVQAYGNLGPVDDLDNFSGIQIGQEEVKALSRAGPGEEINLSAAEVATFKVEAGSPARAAQEQLRRLLTGRYQAYRSSGLDGIAPYDRGDGRLTDNASDLKKAGESVLLLKKYMPAFHAVLLGYPQARLAGMEERFQWVKSGIHGHSTCVLTHLIVASGGAARAVLERDFYVSTGYNVEQAVAGLLPVEGGTIVVYTSHAFTDQVAGAGGAMKRSIGRRVMAGTLRKIFEAEQAIIENEKRRATKP